MSSLDHESDAPRTLSDSALEKLRRAILTGDLAPGSQLRLRELIDRLDMSSVPIREALRYLEHTGLVERRPHHGAVVAPVSVEDFRETWAIRIELETMAIRLAAERMTAEYARAVEQLMDEYAVAFNNDEPHAHALHRRVHMALYDAAGSKWLQRLIPMLWDNSERYRPLSLAVRDKETTLAEHRSIIRACVNRDPESAVRALRDHLRETTNTAIEALEAGEWLPSDEASARAPEAGTGT